MQAAIIKKNVCVCVESRIGKLRRQWLIHSIGHFNCRLPNFLQVSITF